MSKVRIPIAREWMNASYMALRPEMDLLEAIQKKFEAVGAKTEIK